MYGPPRRLRRVVDGLVDRACSRAPAVQPRPTRRWPLARPTTAADRHVVATKRGLWCVQGAQVERLAWGHFYGLTVHGDRLLAFQRGERTGVLWEWRGLGRARAPRMRMLRSDLSPGVHQIDRWGEALLVCDTYHNAVLVLDLERGHTMASHTPFGALTRGRASDNYAHLNSLFALRDGLAVLCHNESAKTARSSEIALLDSEFRCRARIPTPARSGHNLIPYRGKPLYCDSLGSALYWGREPAFHADCFTRGLSVTEDSILVGGSEYADRAARSVAAGCLYELDPDDFGLRRTLPMPGMVQEIRCLDRPDYGLSAATPEPAPTLARWTKQLALEDTAATEGESP